MSENTSQVSKEELEIDLKDKTSHTIARPELADAVVAFEGFFFSVGVFPALRIDGVEVDGAPCVRGQTGGKSCVGNIEISKIQVGRFCCHIHAWRACTMLSKLAIMASVRRGLRLSKEKLERDTMQDNNFQGKQR